MAYELRFPAATTASIIAKYKLASLAQSVGAKPFQSHLCDTSTRAISDCWMMEDYLREEVELCESLLCVIPVLDSTMDDRIAIAERKALANWWIGALYGSNN